MGAKVEKIRKLISFALWGALVAAFPVGAWAEPTPKELPPVETVRPEGLGSVTDLLLGMGITERLDPKRATPPTQSFGQRPPGSYVLHEGIDAIEFEVQTARDFIDGKGMFEGLNVPANQKGVIVTRYGFTHPAAAELMKYLKDQGAHSAVLLTDGPISMDASQATFENGGTGEDGKKKRSSNWTNDIRPEYLTGRQGEAIQGLLDHGYDFRSPVLSEEKKLTPAKLRVNKGSFFVAASALYRNLEMGPIMHEKSMIMYVLKDPKKPVTAENIADMYVVHGTANWTNPHVNRTYFYRDDMKGENGLGRAAFAHAMELVKTFTHPESSARIPHVETIPRLRVEGQDGSHWEVGYTDGQHELNTRIADFFKEVAANPKKYQINEVVLSHFVFTNRAVLESMFEAWAALKAEGRPFKVRGVLDAKFVGMRNFGISAAMENFSPLNPFGKMTKGLGKEFAESVEVNVFFKKSPGATNIDPDGPPVDRHLWHDKTTLIDWQTVPEVAQTPGRRWLEVWTGSYNNSTNKNNAERQDALRIPFESPLARDLLTSVEGVKEQYRGSGEAVRMEGAILLQTVAEFLGHEPMDLDIKKVKRVTELLSDQAHFTPEAIAEAQKILRELHGAQPSRLIERLQVSTPDMELRTQAFGKFLAWYAALPPDLKGFDARLSPQEWVGVAMSLTETPYAAKSALTYLLWKPGVDRHTLVERARQAYDTMGLKEVFEAAGHAGAFPSEHHESVPHLEMTPQDTYQLRGKLGDGDFKAAAEHVLKIVDGSGMDPESRAKFADAAVLEKRFEGLMRFFSWYDGLPYGDPKHERLARMERYQLFSRALSEDLGLISLKEPPQALLEAMVDYMIRLRGFREAQSKELIKQGIAVLGGGEPAPVEGVTSRRSGDPACPWSSVAAR